MIKVVCLLGPTAVGKTHLAMSLVHQFPLEIISVDSALIYRGMDIGTAKPTPEELKQAPHHLLNILDPNQSYSAADFVKDATRLCHEIHARGKIPFLVGGTMMYFKALEQGLAAMPSADPSVRQQLQSRGEKEGWETLHAELSKIDPKSAARINPNDPQRLQRALEVFLVSGQTMTQWWEQQSAHQEFQFVNIGLMPSDRAWLHDRIERRWKQMLDQGFENEVRQLIARGDLSADSTSIRTVGYRQMWEYCHNEVDHNTMVQKGLVATRQLAKRQMTWLRHWPEITLLDPCDPAIADQVFNLISQALGR